MLITVVDYLVIDYLTKLHMGSRLWKWRLIGQKETPAVSPGVVRPIMFIKRVTQSKDVAASRGQSWGARSGPGPAPSILTFTMSASGLGFCPPPTTTTRPEINNRVTRKQRRFDTSECDKKKSITRLLSPSLPHDPDERKGAAGWRKSRRLAAGWGGWQASEL